MDYYNHVGKRKGWIWKNDSLCSSEVKKSMIYGNKRRVKSMDIRYNNEDNCKLRMEFHNNIGMKKGWMKLCICEEKRNKLTQTSSKPITADPTTNVVLSERSFSITCISSSFCSGSRLKIKDYK